MTLTQFGYCRKCDEDRVELVPVAGGVLACHKCGNINVYDSRQEFEATQ